MNLPSGADCILCAVMRHRLSVVLTLVAWLFATGSQWDLVQTFAWAGMFSENVRTMSVLSAVQRTFSPEGRCAICEAVSRAKQHEAATPVAPEARVLAKIVLACGPAVHVFLSPAPLCAGLAQAPLAPVSASRSAPPSPPPRALV
jgi:hypothetical protein